MYAKILLMTAVLLTGQVYAQTTATGTTEPVKTTKTKKKKKKAVPGATTSEAQTTTTTAPAIVPAPETKPAEKKEEKLTTAQEVTKYLKEHFSATYHGEYYFQRRMDDYLASEDAGAKDNRLSELQDFKVMHNPTLIYKPTKDWQILSTAEFKYADQDNITSFPNTFYRALFTVTRKNILNEKDHGVQLDAGIGRRQFNTKTITDSSGFPILAKGNDRVFTTITKTFGKNNASLFFQYLYNDPKQTKVTTWKHSLEIIPTVNLQLTEKLSYLFNDDIVINTAKGTNPHKISTSHEMNAAYINYQWTDKISTYYQLKYLHIDTFNAVRNNDDWFEHYAGVGYALTPKFTITAEVGNEIIHSNDGRDFFGRKAAYPEFALYLDAAL